MSYYFTLIIYPAVISRGLCPLSLLRSCGEILIMYSPIDSSCCKTFTDFWHLMKNYFGTDEDIDEAALDEAQSLADILKLKKQWSKEDVPSISKASAELDDDITILDDDCRGAIIKKTLLVPCSRRGLLAYVYSGVFV